MRNSYNVKGMTCSHCAKVMHDSLTKVAGVASVTVDMEKASVIIESQQPIVLSALQAALADTIYEIGAPGTNDGTPLPVQMDDLSEQNKQLVIDYITALGRLDDKCLSEYLHPDFQYNGVLQCSVEDFLQMIRSHAASHMHSILVGNDIQAIFVDGDECCVIYNIVTSMPGKAVPFVEQIKIKDGKVISTDVRFNKHCMKQLSQEIGKINSSV